MVLSEDEKSDTEDQEETEVGVMEDQRSVILHLISQLKLGMDLTKVGGRVPWGLWPVVWAPSVPHRLSRSETGDAEWRRVRAAVKYGCSGDYWKGYFM